MMLLGVCFFFIGMSKVFLHSTYDLVYFRDIIKWSPLLVEDSHEVLVVNRDNTILAVPVSALSLQTTMHQEGGVNASTTSLEACPHRCAERGTEERRSKVKLLIAITSTCCTKTAMQRRKSIRETWMKDGLDMFSDVVSIKFVLSTPPTLANEQQRERVREQLREEMRGNPGKSDIVLLNYAPETYKGLTYKTIGIMRYLKHSSCAFTHVLKVDDDIYVRVAGVLEMLGIRNSEWPHALGYDEVYAQRAGAQFNRTVLGQIHYKGFKPNRDPASKWFVPYAVLPDSEKLPRVEWPAGWSYILSRDLGEYIVNRSDLYESLLLDKRTEKSVPHWYKPLMQIVGIEDVTVGFFLTELGVVPTPPPPPPHGDTKSLELKIWSQIGKPCSKLTVFKNLDMLSLALMPVLSVCDRSGLWRIRDVECRVSDDPTAFKALRRATNFSTTKDKFHDEEKLIQSRYDIHPLPTSIPLDSS